MVGRCTGHCCDTIPLNYSPDTLAALTLNPDAQFVLNNWEYLGELTVQEAGVLDKVYMRREFAEGFARMHFYQCLRWDAATGNCTVYDSRPRLCKDHPTSGTGPCERKECTSDSARNRPCGPLAPKKRRPRSLSIFGPLEVKCKEQ